MRGSMACRHTGCFSEMSSRPYAATASTWSYRRSLLLQPHDQGDLGAHGFRSVGVVVFRRGTGVERRLRPLACAWIASRHGKRVRDLAVGQGVPLCHFSVAQRTARVFSRATVAARTSSLRRFSPSPTRRCTTRRSPSAREAGTAEVWMRGGRTARPQMLVSYSRAAHTGLHATCRCPTNKCRRFEAKPRTSCASEAPGRQWHSSEILSEISERMDGGFDGLDKYVLDIALAGSDSAKIPRKNDMGCGRSRH